jgi:hypothetical protein
LTAEVRIGDRSLDQLILNRARVEVIDKFGAAAIPLLTSASTGLFDAGNAFSDTEPYFINQSVWIEVLAEIDYRRTLLVEVSGTRPERLARVG